MKDHHDTYGDNPRTRSGHRTPAEIARDEIEADESVKDFLPVELVIDSACPNVEPARTAIRTALKTLGFAEKWQEWDRDSEETPRQLRMLGSPSVLVNGLDVGCTEGETAHADANSCRIYLDESGCVCGAPTAGMIVRAFERQKITKAASDIPARA